MKKLTSIVLITALTFTVMVPVMAVDEQVNKTEISISMDNAQMHSVVGGQSGGNLRKGPSGGGVSWYCYMSVFLFAGQIVAGSFAMAANPVLGTILLYHLFYAGSAFALYDTCRG